MSDPLLVIFHRLTCAHAQRVIGTYDHFQILAVLIDPIRDLIVGLISAVLDDVRSFLFFFLIIPVVIRVIRVGIFVFVILARAVIFIVAVGSFGIFLLFRRVQPLHRKVIGPQGVQGLKIDPVAE